ncbi:hypothetical protein MM1S1540310_3969 [Mycobacteroides abscessus subsp. bolletii 1S-154-0310]|nr:hypothetical protein MM1S1510930_4412 [Mycobacteroides abscessus subsp. bolletii 1S-151-0930]EIU68710.1 hypothetical protein MM1S1520914_4621 [Mycobacteroides abscessus subsp. bolletii 1S-152-0914]EIU71165.1 hypothetical protein MM1S1530915_3965 [Mycobacteroides abscessus subsp. bolletii 1S-153-0915]EIU81048.1 hypothetical protein MM1S1540310_3969 [Mycobacteroides abscessus subsp. bolletii 1S-154-0310]
MAAAERSAARTSLYQAVHPRRSANVRIIIRTSRGVLVSAAG